MGQMGSVGHGPGDGFALQFFVQLSRSDTRLLRKAYLDLARQLFDFRTWVEQLWMCKWVLNYANYVAA